MYHSISMYNCVKVESCRNLAAPEKHVYSARFGTVARSRVDELFSRQPVPNVADFPMSFHPATSYQEDHLFNLVDIQSLFPQYTVIIIVEVKFSVGNATVIQLKRIHLLLPTLSPRRFPIIFSLFPKVSPPGRSLVQPQQHPMQTVPLALFVSSPSPRITPGASKHDFVSLVVPDSNDRASLLREIYFEIILPHDVFLAFVDVRSMRASCIS
jgi:hypothetical protein